MITSTALSADIELLNRDADGARTAFSLPADDPVFAGHYPGFPVLPGVYLVEAADRTVRQWAGRPLVLAEMGRCRFNKPVYPGDRVVIGIKVTTGEDGLRVKASISTDNGRVADIRLSYRTENEEVAE